MPLYKSHVNCRLFKISAFMLGVTLGNYRAGDETLKYLSSEVGTRGSLEVKCGQEEPGTPLPWSLEQAVVSLNWRGNRGRDRKSVV